MTTSPGKIRILLRRSLPAKVASTINPFDVSTRNRVLGIASTTVPCITRRSSRSSVVDSYCWLFCVLFFMLAIV